LSRGLAITYVLNVEMGHARTFKTLNFEYLFNDIKNSSMQLVLTPEIAL
jgi:hypothetical protein